MDRRQIAVILRVMLGMFAAAGAIFFFLFLPFYAEEYAQAAPEYAWARIPCLIWAWSFSIPLFAACVPAWQILGTISDAGRAFCRQNGTRFMKMAVLAWTDTAVFPLGMLILAGMGAGSAPLTLVVTPAVVLTGLCMGFVCYAMSRLVSDAACMREENELTI